MNRALLFVVLALLVLLSGCADKSVESWVEDGHPFAPPPAGTLDHSRLPATAPEERPIVRILSGTEVTGPEEALSLMTTPHPHTHTLGLRTMVDQLAVREVPLIQVAATLAELSGYNIAVTRQAADIPVTVYLRDIPLRQAMEAICRLNDLWYREDDRIITLMTTREYGEEMVIRRNEKSRAYWLRYTNANDMAKILQAVMSTKVQFNDIGSEEVYGHVSETKAAGSTISGGGDETAAASFNVEEVRRLLALSGPGGLASSNALDLNLQLERDVPAVITVFKRNNAIIARSLDETILEDIGRVIELMDTPTSQVLLEISILQLNLGEGFESFFQLDVPGAYQYAYPDNIFDYDPSGATPIFRPDREVRRGESSVTDAEWSWNPPVRATTGDVEEEFYRFNYGGREILYPVKALGTTIGSSLGLANTTFDVLFGNRRIQARLQLYASDNRAEVLATPYLMSANNSRVEFFVGEEVPLRDDVESTVLFNQEGFITTNIFDVKIKREELGTDIGISSFINEDGTITMDLEAEISFPQYGISSIGVVNTVTGAVVPFPLDGVDRSKLTSIITAASGQTIAIGGIIRERLEEYEKKVPILGDIPLFGFFFKEVNDKRAKIETVILITPHIITHPALAGRTSRDFLERRSSHPRITRDQETLLDYPTVENTTGLSTPPEPDASPDNVPAEQR
ncbi:type II secretion system protein GspD [Desulfobulbus alkaliphilus]|uniref:type II secretion system protein GspD n=1 Tax=Desulfobulbus alkaliphilus TaxID=869814 RepID=UPI001964CAFD|nr:hypothetical protein [Desulfobulbus alkaliphilus]MBM9536576.1 hypothetical protein [Desulfobulbus alkaliphilus]